MRKILVYSLNKENFYSFCKYYKDSKYLQKEYKLYLFEPSKNKVLNFFNKIKYMFFKRADIVISDYPTRVLDSSKKFSITMGHGTAIKKFPSSLELENKKNFSLISTMKRCKYYLVTNDRQSELELRSKKLDEISKNTYLPLGIPKNDALFLEKNRKKSVFKNKVVILYMPTFRDYDNKDDFDSNFFEKLFDFLIEKNAVFLIKFHPSDKIFDYGIIPKEYREIIVDAEKLAFNEDELLLESDILISDYSSIFVKYLILDKPILLYWYDFNKYKSTRGIDIDYKNKLECPGDVAFTQSDFFDKLSNFFEGEYNSDFWKNIRQDNLNTYYKYIDGFSSERIWKLIDSEIRKAD